jgi:hypothetical protein
MNYSVVRSFFLFDSQTGKHRREVTRVLDVLFDVEAQGLLIWVISKGNRANSLAGFDQAPVGLTIDAL